ncbi:hypothetical protein [Gloeobacter kilaueensis]|uniref:Uncharacterized protein n=1 Tax=Gloeobacter kilaueensis (strain ATCC BAA-2537 / CCAP 1431/1 / ULC 316 / JS1) TaxID=1183438 RepID=U5QHM6_GLOK1|nr:hypothetical protein [Gloeobacter kilaueensis]AGY58472.1 hypothetical protein GKIL_2226 [Gloeobacter kilaueensis JS1]
MTIHPDLTRHVEERFLPALPSPHREAARILYTQLRRLDALSAQAADWFGPDQPAPRAQCEQALIEVAVEVREAYKIVLALAQPPV